MQRPKILVLVSTMILTLGAIFGVATASATPEFILAEGSFPVTLTGTSGEGLLETAEKTAIKCTKSTSKGEITNAKAGKLTISFEECKLGAGKCKSVGSSTGVILTEGPTTLVTTHLSAVDAGFLVEPKELSIECEPSTKVLVKGTFLVPMERVDLPSTLFEALQDQKTGKPLSSAYWDSSGKEQKALLQTSINGGKLQESAYAAVSPKFTFSKEVEIRTGPLVEADPVKSINAGGTAGGVGTNTCLFTAVNQTCEIRVENVSPGEIEIRVQDVSERVAFVHYKESYVKIIKRAGECESPTFFGWIKGTRLLAATFCMAELKLVQMPALPAEVNGGYYVGVTAAGAVAGSSIAFNAKE